MRAYSTTFGTPRGNCRTRDDPLRHLAQLFSVSLRFSSGSSNGNEARSFQPAPTRVGLRLSSMPRPTRGCAPWSARNRRHPRRTPRASRGLVLPMTIARACSGTHHPQKKTKQLRNGTLPRSKPQRAAFEQRLATVDPAAPGFRR